VNVPLLIPTFGVVALSCATTKYWILSPATIGDWSNPAFMVKVNGEEVEVVSTNFQPLSADVLPA
jgi:hypothetical protein